MFCWYIILLIGSVYCFPATLLGKLIGNTQFKDEDNSLTSFNDEFPNFDIYFKGNLTNDTKKQTYTNEIIPFTSEFSDGNKTSLVKNSTVLPSNLPRLNTTTNIISTSQANSPKVNGTLDLPISPAPTNLDPVSQTNNKVNDTRNPRQGSIELTEENASQEEESSEEDGGNMITGLLSAFLSGLSRPDGSIDLEAILGLLGSLSTQNPDGTYDFNGLTEILRGFLGGGADGGGSDIGSFTAGLLGAVIKGVANPPGPKGAGILTGKIVTGLLPALSGPIVWDYQEMALRDIIYNQQPTKVPSEGDMMSGHKSPPLDSGSFLTGFVKAALGSGGNGTMSGGKQSKYTLFKLIFSAITGVFSASSSLSSKSDWN